MSLLTGASMTAAEVARELGLTHANASYHLRNLLAGGFIVLGGEERIRGGVAKRYRYDPERDRGKATDDGGDQALFTAVAEEMIRRTRTAHWPGAKGMSDAEVWVDPDDWKRITRSIGELAVELHRLAKPPRTPGTIRTSTTIAMFQMEAES